MPHLDLRQGSNRRRAQGASDFELAPGRESSDGGVDTGG